MEDNKVYIVAHRSNDWLGKTIRFFSSFRFKEEPYDHITIVKGDYEYNMGFPRAQRRPRQYRDANVEYPYIGDNADKIINYCESVTRYKTRYGFWQVVSKILTMMFGISPIKARMDCIEFVVTAIAGDKVKDVDKFTVSEGLFYLLNNKYIV